MLDKSALTGAQADDDSILSNAVRHVKVSCCSKGAQLMAFTAIEAADLDLAAAYRMITACVVPRPIAWISTISRAGLVNVAPFSSYNYVASAPPMVAVNISSREGKLKDTARNIVETGQFVVNMPGEHSLEAMHGSSAEFAPDVSEAEALGIALLPSLHVTPPRIAEAPIQLECQLDQAVLLGDGINTLYIGKVITFHLDETIFDGRHVDVTQLRPLVRLAGPHYAGLGEPMYRAPAFVPPGIDRN